MAISQDFLDYCTERLSLLGKVSMRKMFGGAGYYLNGKMFALTNGDGVYLKADEQNRARFEARRMEKFVPFEDKQQYKMGYYLLSSEDLEDDDTLRELGKLSIEASDRAALSKKTKGAKTKTNPSMGSSS
ncbi:TfoX/Sxy family protein [bacterium]|nr:TfoX/Sxy family protein [bacterium]